MAGKLNKHKAQESPVAAASPHVPLDPDERKRLMEEAASHLKGRRRLSKKELAQDPYINVKKT